MQEVIEADVSWTPIGQTSNQLILYHPPSHALSVQPHPIPDAGPSNLRKPLLLRYDSRTPQPEGSDGACPYCSQPLPAPFPAARQQGSAVPPAGPLGRTPYFQVLERAHEGSRPPSPRLRQTSPSPSPYIEPDIDPPGSGESLPSKGYYARFFREEGRLGMGAEGSVFLATHIIGGNVLGTYAVKKIAVGESKEYLVRMLREVRLLESLRHPNIIPYHHSWIEPTRFSSFGPPINALHVLMMYATAGNLDTFLLTRSHSTQAARPDLSAGDIGDAESLGQLPKAERIKAFKKRRASGISNAAKREETRGVLLLGLEEISKLFGDVLEGLAFLKHGNSILHLDLKCSNVLLHWEDGKLTPKAMISDFGTSEEMLMGKRQRTGHTGTMEYMAPETLKQDSRGEWRPSDSHADMWALGMILHKLLFLHLPYPDTDDFDVLHADILRYPGFIPSPELVRACERRHIPRDLLVLLAKLVNVNPESRPSAEKVRLGLRSVEAQFSAPRDTSAGGGGGVVARFASPFSGILSRRNPDTSAEISVIPPSEDWRVSPVRSLLALPPSPSTENAPNADLIPPVVSGPSRSSTLLRPRTSDIRSILFVIKVISIQPAIAGEGWTARPWVVCFLVVLAVLAYRAKGTKAPASLAVVHIAVWIAVTRSSLASRADVSPSPSESDMPVPKIL